MDLTHITYPNTEHNPFLLLIGIERESGGKWEIGGAFFKNSYYQSCVYVYGGKRWVIGPDDKHFYFKLTAGPILGYTDSYEDKLPVNDNGIGVGVIPAFGYKYDRFSIQFVMLALSGIMLTAGYDIIK